jgi:hypothetical protein
MEDVKSKRCQASSCIKLNPAFNAPGETRGWFCAAHRLPGMENVVSKRCEASGCTRHPAFNTPGEVRGRFCAEHRLPGMENVRSRRCEAGGCGRQAAFNAPGHIHGRLCAEHRLHGMENVMCRRCEVTGCTKLNPAFNTPGAARGRFCSAHRLPGMEDVQSKRCEASGCTRTRRTFNLPGLRPSHCSEHRQSGMIRNPRMRCTQPDCKEWSTDGRTEPLRCEAHALPSVKCEQARMINVSQDLAAPRTLWIRYNLDAYASEFAQVAPRVRLDTLRRVLLRAIEASPEACASWPVIGVTQLFFDGFVSARATEVQSLDHILV